MSSPRLSALGLIAVASIGSWMGAPESAHADAQVSSRLGIGGGARRGALGAVDGRFEMLLRAEVLFGGARPDVVRVGPAIDLRTGNFASAEVAGGLTLLLPVASGWPLWLTAGAGYAARDDGPSAAIGLVTIAFGYRDYDYSDPYGFAVDVYATYRTDFEDPSRFEITAGLSFDLELIFVLPTRLLATWITAGDPDE